MPTLGGRRGVVPLLALLVVILAALWVTHGADPSASSPSSGGSSSGSGSGSGSVDPASGLTWVAEADLPSQARTTLGLIDRGGPYPYPRNDDVTFRNSEGVLPDEDSGYYREYTVTTPGSPDRGPRRIVAGDGGELYYTDDHYASFERIRR